MNQNINTFFILSLGRSGTKFLAELLNKCKNTKVQHEPNLNDYQILSLSYYYPESYIIENYLKLRFSNIFQNLGNDIKLYGEVNSLLRYNVDYLKNKLNARLIHIVRDGREVIKSIYARDTYTAKDRHLSIFPKNNDLNIYKWKEYSRFEKICWYWMHTNEYLGDKIGYTVRFEDLLKDYNYFKEKILDFLGLEIREEIWLESRKKKVNKSSKYQFKKHIKNILLKRAKNIQQIPKYSKWDQKMLNSFWNICGENMKKYGYL